MIPDSPYWLINTQIPAGFLETPGGKPEFLPASDGLCRVDLKIVDGQITALIPGGTQNCSDSDPIVDLKEGQVWPCFVDVHTHLDKGHIWERAPNPDGTFEQALATVFKDAESWHPEDVYRRWEFGLKCSYAHGTQAIRTHLDAFGEQALMSFGVFQTLQQQWVDRLKLQAVSLVTLDYYGTPAGEKLVALVAQMGGVLGGVAYMNPELPSQLDRVFELAQAWGLDLDFHTDETGDPESLTLQEVAKAALRHQFSGQIVCGHCCSLAVQSPQVVAETLTLVKETGIAIVSLPLCNLYLQDRQPGRTPRWRGVTLLHELEAAGVPVALASDNCRDPFYGFGDHDLLEVFTMAVRIAHLDPSYPRWPASVTQVPARLMGDAHLGKIGAGYPADLILFKGRTFSELLSRPQTDRIVLRNGVPIDTTLPDYQELDDLMLIHHKPLTKLH